MKYLISWICWKKSCFFQIFLKFYFKKLVADIKTWGKNIIKLDSIFVLGASFFPTKRPLFYWLCISRYIYSMIIISDCFLKKWLIFLWTNLYRPNIVEYTDFYNVSLDHMDLMAEYYAWQNPERPGQFSYCQVMMLKLLVNRHSEDL